MIITSAARIGTVLVIRRLAVRAIRRLNLATLKIDAVLSTCEQHNDKDEDTDHQQDNPCE